MMNQTNKTPETIGNPPETMPIADISFGSPFDKDARFNLRYAFVSEEIAIKEQFTALADLEEGQSKKEKEFRVCLDALTKFAFTDADAQMINKKFGEFTAKNERAVRLAYSNYTSELHGGASFL